jgi:hypothetical protein
MLEGIVGPGSIAFIKENGPLVSNILSIGLNVGMNFLGTNFVVFRVPEPKELFD